jgi:hypothetical protein
MSASVLRAIIQWWGQSRTALGSVSRIDTEARAFRNADVTTRNLRYGRVLGLLEAGTILGHWSRRAASRVADGIYWRQSADDRTDAQTLGVGQDARSEDQQSLRETKGGSEQRSIEGSRG